MDFWSDPQEEGEMIVQTIKENIIDSIYLFSILLGFHRSKPLKQSSVPLLPAIPHFCSVCHMLVANTRKTDRGMQIIQNGKVLVTIKGKETSDFPISCPNGHKVVLK